MKLIRLTAYSTFIMALMVSFTACEKNSEKNKVLLYQRTDIPMTGAQIVPATASTALGSMDVFYNKETRILNYNIRFSGLTDSVVAIHIHGLSPAGFGPGAATPIIQNIVASSNGIFPQKTTGKYTYAKTGTLSGTLLADGVVVKEQDLLNGSYFIDIHSVPYSANGEIRGQIIF